MKYDFNKKHVSVVGMGKSGMAAAALLSKQGAEVLILDDDKNRAIPPGQPSSMRFQLGGWHEDDLTSADLVVLSPGVALNRLPVARLRALGIPLIAEVELAASLLSAPIIAITGTNGKSTTTTLVGEILRDWGWQVFVGGNLGLPLSEAVSSPWDFIVAELSSFQLESVSDLCPRIAALLNITPDHLDRYPDFQSYQRAKWRIFENQGNQDYAVLNLDDPLSLPPSLKSSAAYFSRRQKVDYGVYLYDGEIFSTIRGEPESVCRLDALHFRQSCLIENILAATAIALLCGCAIEGIAEVLTRFQGLPHRMEFVRSHQGVQYLDDSKGTNVGAVIRSVESLQGPVILIAGGRSKGTDFTPLRDPVLRKVKQLILIGETKEAMLEVFSGHAHCTTADSMQDAVAQAASAAKPGDSVLLSPACASFDMFRDYAHRGETFKEAVGGLS